MTMMAGAVVYGAVALARGGDEHSPFARNVQAQRGAVVTTARGAWNRALPTGGGRGQVSGQSDGFGQGARNWGQQAVAGVSGRRLTLAETAPHAWETIEGVVTALPDLEITLDDGTVVEAGLGPDAYRQAADFNIEIGQRLSVFGYEEDGEFKAAEVTNLTTDERITLRDESGRPAWAGQGQGRNRQL